MDAVDEGRSHWKYTNNAPPAITPAAIVPTKVNDAITWLIRLVHLPLPDGRRDGRPSSVR